MYSTDHLKRQSLKGLLTDQLIISNGSTVVVRGPSLPLDLALGHNTFYYFWVSWMHNFLLWRIERQTLSSVQTDLSVLDGFVIMI